MYLQEIIEVAIGMVFVWFLVSLSVMTVQEWIAARLKWRATDLETALRRLIDDPSFDQKVGNFWNLFKFEIVIKLWKQLFKIIRRPMKKDEVTTTKPTQDRTIYTDFMNNLQISSLSKDGTPSYISASKFASVVMDTVLTAGTKDSVIQKGLKELEHEIYRIKESERLDARKMFDNLTTLVQTSANTKEGKAFLNNKKKEIIEKYPGLEKSVNMLFDIPKPTQNLTETLDSLAQGAAVIAVKNDKIREALTGLVGSVKGLAATEENALANARTNLENYFNDYMDRLGGVYKRRAQVWAFCIGLVLAILLNIDSYNIMQHLWREPTLRQSIVAQAEKSVKDGSTTENIDVPQLQTKLGELNLPIGWVQEADPSLCKLSPTPSIDDNDVFCMFGLRTVNRTDASASSFFTWLIGVVITGGAAAQGSPFWFEILGKLVNIRSTGIKPEEKEQKAAAAKAA